MDIIIISVTILMLAVIAARVLLRHTEFRDVEYVYNFDRNATNEETTGALNYSVLQRDGQITRKHQATP